MTLKISDQFPAKNKHNLNCCRNSLDIFANSLQWPHNICYKAQKESQIYHFKSVS